MRAGEVVPLRIARPEDERRLQRVELAQPLLGSRVARSPGTRRASTSAARRAPRGTCRRRGASAPGPKRRRKLPSRPPAPARARRESASARAAMSGGVRLGRERTLRITDTAACSACGPAESCVKGGSQSARPFAAGFGGADAGVVGLSSAPSRGSPASRPCRTPRTDRPFRRSEAAPPPFRGPRRRAAEGASLFQSGLGGGALGGGTVMASCGATAAAGKGGAGPRLNARTRRTATRAASAPAKKCPRPPAALGAAGAADSELDTAMAET